MFRWHFKCHRRSLEMEDESIFPRHVDNGAASPSIDGIFLIEHAIEEVPIFGHLHIIGQAESGTKEGILIMEVEVRIGLVVVADQAGTHFWLAEDSCMDR